MERRPARWIVAAALLGSVPILLPAARPDAVLAQEEDPKKEAAELVGLVRPLIEQGRYDEARRKLARAVEADPQNVDAALLVATAWEQTGFPEKAVAALAAFDADAAALTRRSELLLATGDDAGAEAAVRKALEQDEDSLPARRQLGLVLEETGRHEEAVETYLEVNRRWARTEGEDTDDDLLAVGRARLGIFRLSSEYRPNLNSVITRLEPVVRRSPKRVDVLVELADLYLQSQQDQDAKRWYTKALDENPYYAPAIFGLARQKAFRFDGPGAATEAERALRGNPAYVPALLFLAEMDLGDANYERAEERIGKALEVNPVGTATRSTRAALHYARGDAQAFDAEVAAIHARDATSSLPFRTTARVLEEQRRFADALVLAERAIEVNPRDWDAYFLAGRNAMNVGEDDKAESYLKKAEKEDPFNNLFRENFVKLFDKMSRFPTRKDDRFVVKLAPAEEEAYYALVRRALGWSLDLLEKKWDFKSETPLFISVFDQQNDFATRTIGLPGFPALGACFGRVVTLDSPRALPPGAFGWRGTLHHELAHVITLQLSQGRVPRWLTEGISVYEERKVTPMWNREMERDLLDALASDELLELHEINNAFRGSRVLFAYYQGGLMCELIERDFGFDKLREMVRLYGEGLQTPDVVRRALGVEPEEFDRRFKEYAQAYVADLRVLPRPAKRKMSKLKMHLRRRKGDVDGWLLYAMGHLARKKSADALSAVAKAVKLRPEDNRIPTIRALVAWQQGRPDTAVRFAADALEKGADYYELHMLLAEVAVKNENFDVAKKHFRAAIAAFPYQKGQGDPRLLLARLLLGEGESALPEAMALLRGHADVDEDDVGTRLRLAAWHRDNDRAAEELGTLLEIRDIVPLPNGDFGRDQAVELHERLGELFLDQKGYEEAELSLRTAVGVARMKTGQREDPPVEGIELADLMTRHAECLHLIGRKSEARRRLQEALAADPENDAARELLDRIDPE